MLTTVLGSALIGLTLGAGNAVASYALWRAARGREQRAFLRLVLGGMVVRLVLVLALVGVVLVALPVHRTAFVGVFFAAFMLGTAAEIAHIQRRAAA